MKRTLLSAAALALALSLPNQSRAISANDVTFGIAPHHSAIQLAQMWAPMLDELSARTGVTFRFRTTPDRPTFEACLASGAFDFAYMPPMHYAVFSQDASYRAIAHPAGDRLQGVMVVRADSGHTDVASLQGEHIAFTSPGDFGASMLNRAVMAQNDVSFHAKYVISPDLVYRAVAAGLMDAGGGEMRTWRALDPDLRAQLKIVSNTQSFTPHAFAVHADTDPQLAQNVQQHLVNISRTAPDALSGLGISGLVAAQDGDWDDVRAMGMSKEGTGISDQGYVQCPYSGKAVHDPAMIALTVMARPA